MKNTWNEFWSNFSSMAGIAGFILGIAAIILAVKGCQWADNL